MFSKIYIEITNVCNLNCDFCPQTNRQKGFMSLEQFEEIIKKIKSYTKLVCLHVKGEPLIHKDLKNMLEILEKYNLKTNITTNGTLIKENLEVLKQAKSIRQINFSIHSSTQNKKTNKKYLQNIFTSTEELKNLIISYRLWNLKTLNDNECNKNIIKEIENYYKINDLTEKMAKNEFLKLRENLFINQDIEFTWPNLKNDTIIEKGRCLALKEQIAILVDGTVVPCCLDNNGDIKLGNIFQETMEEILNKPKSIEIKKNFENSIISCQLCKTCGFLKKLENKRKKERGNIK